MRWTKDKPTTDGWYWCKCLGTLTGNVFESPVKVYNKGETVFWDGTNFSIDCSNFLEWSDLPIPSIAQREVGQIPLKLHNHGSMERQLGVPEGHIIIDSDVFYAIINKHGIHF